MTSSNDWQKVRFGDIVRNVNTTVSDPLGAGLERTVGLDDLDSNSLALKRSGDLSTGTTFTKRFGPGQVLFGKRRAYQRKVAVSDFEGVCSGDILVLEAVPESLHPELLPFITQSDPFFEHALRTSRGSLSPRTSWRDLAAFEVDLPPLEVQRRMADLLWSVETTGVKGAELMQALRQLLDAVVIALLTKSEGWPVVECHELLVTGPRNGYSPVANDSGLGYPTLSIGAVQDGRVVADGYTKFAQVDPKIAADFRLRPGDVLVVRGNGNRDLTGRCGIVGDIPEGCFFPDLLIRLQFDTDKMLPAFAVMQWNTGLKHREFLTRAKSTNGIWKINGGDIKRHQLLLPPLAQQHRTLAEVAEIDESLSGVRRSLESLRSLKAGLLGNLLRPSEATQ